MQWQPGKYSTGMSKYGICIGDVVGKVDALKKVEIIVALVLIAKKWICNFKVIYDFYLFLNLLNMLFCKSSF